MNNNKPLASIGIPVFNGENYLEQAIDSFLAQTFTDFEIIISDNASTDGTEKICRRYASKDTRIRYYRNAENIGAVPNYNRIFEMASGEFFKWAAHDDYCAADYLEKCVNVLKENPSVVVCHTNTVYIDEKGEEYGDFDDQLDLQKPSPDERYHDYLFRSYPRCNAIFGLIRTNELRRTPLFGSYLYPDQPLLGELALMGKIYRIPDRMFFRRDHSNQVYRNGSLKKYEIWINPLNINKHTFPYWRLSLEHFCSTTRTPLKIHERIACWKHLLAWMLKNRGRLRDDLFFTDR